MSSPDGEDWLRALMAESRERGSAAEAFFSMLERHGQVVKRADLIYRCRRRCTLALVYRTKEGVVVHLTRYKLSPKVNDGSSSEAGRAKNTEDGDRHWRASTGFLEEGFNLTLNCDHVRSRVIEAVDVESDLKSRAGERVVEAS